MEQKFLTDRHRFVNMSTFLAVFFFGLGLICFLQPEWSLQMEREIKAFGTNKDADEIEFANWWFYFEYVFGILSFLIGFVILFGVI